MSNRLLIYTGNHGKLGGIEDYLTLFKNVFEARGFQVVVSNVLQPNATNIIIDEFTNYFENEKISQFRKNNPNNRCVFILTEFVEKRLGATSCNLFGGILDVAMVSAINVLLRFKRSDFPPLRVYDVTLLLLYSPILAAYLVKVQTYSVIKFFLRIQSGSIFKTLLTRWHRTIYFHMRYLGLKTHLQYADAVITSHEQLMPGVLKGLGTDAKKLKFLGVMYPELDKASIEEKLMAGKEPFIEMTGSITPYRQKWIRKLHFKILMMGLPNGNLTSCQPLGFSSVEGQEIARGAFSLHPPQTKSWKYCSPMRLYRALAVDYNLPILTKDFAQHPIEEVCFLIKDDNYIETIAKIYYDYVTKFHAYHIGPKIDNYNEIVKPRNDALIQAFTRILQEEE